MHLHHPPAQSHCADCTIPAHVEIFGLL